MVHARRTGRLCPFRPGRSGGALLIETRLRGVPRAVRLDLGNFQHAQTEQQVPHQGRMAGVQAGRKYEAGRARTGAAGATGLRTRPAFPMRGRQPQQAIKPVRGTYSLFPGTKCDKRFFGCHCRLLPCCGDGHVSRLERVALIQHGQADCSCAQVGWSSARNKHNVTACRKKNEQSPCHCCSTFEINALPEPGGIR